MDLGIAGKVAIVTGSTRGIGKACAAALAAEGVRIALFSRTQEALDAAAADIRARHECEIITVAGDMTKREDVARLLSTVQGKLGRPDILVLITGRPPRHLREVLDENEDERWEDAYQTNLRGAVFLLEAVTPLMVEAKRGRIVVITSASVKQPMPKHGLSTIFRAGLAAYLKHLANEVARNGVTVNAVAPASIGTEGFLQRPDLQARIDSSPVGRLGTPEECAAAVAFLASEPAGFITGVTLQVDGGMTLSLV